LTLSPSELTGKSAPFRKEAASERAEMILGVMGFSVDLAIASKFIK
jgi:hypothetical protein